MLFAITDQSRVIEACHLQAALEWITYYVDTVKFVFADKARDPEQTETCRLSEKILAYLRLRPDGVSIGTITEVFYQKNGGSEKIQGALRYLLAQNPPCIEQLKTPSGRQGGRPKTTYRLKNSTGKLKNLQNPAVTEVDDGSPTAG
jgi:hypothetical protein